MMIDLSSKIFSFCQIKEEKIRPLLGGACDPTFWQLEEMFQIRIRVFELILVFSYIFVAISFSSQNEQIVVILNSLVEEALSCPM
jgi:hypothetical protein